MLEYFSPLDLPSLTKIGELLQFLTVVIACAGGLYLAYRFVTPKKPDELEFASTIFILTIAIGLLVSIIKQAPAISFGLFGAMSIVRFRAQIKRPQRMIFVFMAAAIGVCCGAGEYVTTIVGTIVLSLLSLASFKLAPSKPAPAAAPRSKAPLRRWELDFVTASLADGRRIRILAILDEATHEALASIPDASFSGARTVAELDRLIATHGKPTIIVSDTWPEFASRAVLEWKEAKSIDWQFCELSSKPEPEPLIATFAQLMREECLDGRGFANVIEARIILENWRTSYNGRIGAARNWQPPVASASNPEPVRANGAQPASGSTAEQGGHIGSFPEPIAVASASPTTPPANDGHPVTSLPQAAGVLS